VLAAAAGANFIVKEIENECQSRRLPNLTSKRVERYSAVSEIPKTMRHFWAKD
jgi:hypothetical protein